MIRSDEFDGLSMLQQNKGCYPLCGPVAQLGARFHGMEEVTGSIPVRSTNYFNNLQILAASFEGAFRLGRCNRLNGRMTSCDDR